MSGSLAPRAIHLALLLLLLAPLPARADWFATPFLGLKFAGSTSIFDLDQTESATKLTLGGSLWDPSDSFFGAEVETAYTPGYFEREVGGLVTSSYVVDLSGNILLALPADITGGGLRPYFAGGFGLIHAEGVELLSILRIRRTMPAITLGVGATGLVSNRLGVRFDLRYLRSIAQEDEFAIRVGRQLNYWRATVGIAARF